jgi:hypothetical protein
LSATDLKRKREEKIEAHLKKKKPPVLFSGFSKIGS